MAKRFRISFIKPTYVATTDRATDDQLVVGAGIVTEVLTPRGAHGHHQGLAAFSEFGGSERLALDLAPRLDRQLLKATANLTFIKKPVTLSVKSIYSPSYTTDNSHFILIAETEITH